MTAVLLGVTKKLGGFKLARDQSADQSHDAALPELAPQALVHLLGSHEAKCEE